MIEPSEKLEDEFVKYIKNLANQAMKKAELELMKMKETKDVLDLPPRKENWDIQENAENDIEERMVKVFSYLEEVAVLTKGLEVFKDGLIYGKLKVTNIIKKRKK